MWARSTRTVPVAALGVPFAWAAFAWAFFGVLACSTPPAARPGTAAAPMAGSAASGSAVSGSADAHPVACLESDVRTFGALEAELLRWETSPPGTTDQQCEVAFLEWKSGRLHEAERTLEDILRSEPRRPDAALLLTRVLRQTGRKEQADSLLARTARAAPDNLHVRLFQAGELEGAEAVEAYDAILAHHPESVEARVASAEARLDLAGEAERRAREDLHSALKLDSLYAPALLLQPQLEEDGQEDARREAVEQAIAADSLSLEARVALAELRRGDGDVAGGFQEFLVALRLDPYNPAAHRRLGNGGSPTSWGRYPPLPDEEVPPELVRLLDEADAQLLSRDLSGAEATLQRALEIHPGYAATLLGLGAVHYYRGDYLEALEQFRDVAAAHPGLGLAHFGVSQSLARLQERSDPEIQAAVDRFREIPRPPEPRRLREVFPDFDRVDEDLQKVILLSVSPLSNYLGVLATVGATYQLIPFHKRLWELPNMERNRGRMTFDLRLWDDVKGQGGFHATAGQEWIRESMYERFNVLAHEFMHQVHSMFTEEQRKELETLFRDAKREERTLDYYADYNEMEYLAQAYEAWISPRKASNQGETAGHDRAEIEGLDPAIVRWLETVNARPSYRENEIVAFRQKIGRLNREGDLESAEAEARGALERYGDHSDLLSALSGVLKFRGEYQEAMEVDRSIVAGFPGKIGGYQALAEDLALAGHDHAGAAEVMAEYLALDPGSDEAWLDLAAYALAAGRYDEVDAALERADSIIGTPNPEGRYFSLKAELALIRGDTAAAREDYEYSLRNISRGNIPAWTELAIMHLRSRELEEAARDLETARAIDRDHPRVREVGALLLDARGELAAMDSLVALHREDPRRLETLTELVSVLTRRDPSRAYEFVEAGRDLLEARDPVSFRYERDRFVAHGALKVPAMERFRGAVEAWEGRTR